MPIQIENIEGLIVSNNEHEQQNQRQPNQNGLGQEIVVQLEDVEVLNNERQNLELIAVANYLAIQPEDDNSQQQVPYMQRIWNDCPPTQQNRNNNSSGGQFYNTNQNQSFGGEYQINMNTNNGNFGRGRTVFRTNNNNNGQYGGGGQFMQQQQGHKRGGSKIRRPSGDGGNGNNNKRMRFGRQSSRSNGRQQNARRVNSISPIRSSSQIASTSSSAYHHNHHQPRAKILDRITINEPANSSESHHSSIHSRLTFGN